MKYPSSLLHTNKAVNLEKIYQKFPPSEIQEIEINPLLVFEQGKGSKVVDARIVIS